MQKKYSIVIPLKNEEENIIELVAEVESVMEKIGDYELILIDDGSTDGTLNILKNLAKTKDTIRLLVFKKNYGQSSAFDAGFKAARGEFIITLDGDRQNDPLDIPLLLKEIENADLVCGRRVNRKDTFTKKITSKMANFVRKRICEDGVSDTGCSLKVYRKEALDKIKMYNGMHRFLPALFTIEGFRIKEVPVNHRERVKGQTKYNFFNRSFNTVADLLAVNWMKKRRLQYQIQEELP